MKYDFTPLRHAKKESDVLLFLHSLGYDPYCQGIMNVPSLDYRYVIAWVDKLATYGHDGHANFEGWEAIYEVEGSEYIGQIIHYRFYHTYKEFREPSFYNPKHVLILHVTRIDYSKIKEFYEDLERSRRR